MRRQEQEPTVSWNVPPAPVEVVVAAAVVAEALVAPLEKSASLSFFQIASQKKRIVGFSLRRANFYLLVPTTIVTCRSLLFLSSTLSVSSSLSQT